MDKLTGFIPEKELYGEMEALINKNGEFALIAVDLDDFYSINRDFGREAGDDVIRLVATCIRDKFPEPCLGFRGGDGFFVIIPNGIKESAFLKAEELRKAICEAKLDYTSAEGRQISQTASIGVASYPDDGSRPADIYRRADSAIARAKKNGRNLVYLAREEKLLPKTSHYTQAQLDKLSLISEFLNVGEATLMREALDELLKKYDAERMQASAHKPHISG